MASRRKANAAAKISAAKKETVEEVKAVVPEVLEDKAEEVVNAVVATEVETAETEKSVEKENAKKSTAKAAKTEAKPAAKKAAKAAKEASVSTSVFVEYRGDQYNMEKLVEAVKADWVAGGHRLSSIKTLNIYIKPEDYTVYYVINDKTHGKVWMQL